MNTYTVKKPCVAETKRQRLKKLKNIVNSYEYVGLIVGEALGSR
jgi:hypothetical protein